MSFPKFDRDVPLYFVTVVQTPSLISKMKDISSSLGGAIVTYVKCLRGETKKIESAHPVDDLGAFLTLMSPVTVVPKMKHFPPLQ